VKDFIEYLKGGDLRSLEKSQKLCSLISNQGQFDSLFSYLLNSDRKVIMRAADVIEKITIKHPSYLNSHKKEILALSNNAKDKELVWHLALLISRIPLTKPEIQKVWKILTNWAIHFKESKIVRVNSLQSLCDLSMKHSEYTERFKELLLKIEKENIPSLNARIRKIRNASR
jgi:hypothetical protein